MFLGHYGLALAARRAAPRTSLGARGLWLLVPWCWWVDRHRDLVPPAP